MNAQEALNEIVRLFDQMDLPEDYTKFIELKDGFASLQKLVHQANAKPKTLEELGWENTWFGDTVDYSNGLIHICFTQKGVVCPVRHSRFNYEEILAIAEKMKELGMTGEQIAKGETVD